MLIKKFRVNYNGVVYLGNTEEDIAKSIVKDFPDKNINEAINMVNALKRKNDNIVTPPNIYKVAEKQKSISGVSLREAKKGAMALIRGITEGHVGQQEINRRAIICTSCPNKNTTSGCRACGAAKAIASFTNSIKSLFGKGFTVPNGLEEYYCKTCSCSLTPMLPSPIDVFQESEEKNSSRPLHCWVNKKSPNYIA